MATTPGACPPGQAQSFDVQNAGSCINELRTIYNAYLAAIAGKTRVVVRFNDRWSEYGKPDAAALLTVYMTLYAQCPSAATSGLPNLNPQLKVKRGPPARNLRV